MESEPESVINQSFVEFYRRKTMNGLKALWALLDGNKTKVGAAIVMAGKFLTYFGRPEGEAVEQFGNMVAGLGLAHAAVKVAKG